MICVCSNQYSNVGSLQPPSVGMIFPTWEAADIVCFEITYLIDGYDLPLANFVGVNHHGQMGCALVSLDDVETFEWVFSSWLVAWPGRHQEEFRILTDETATMSKALGKVMPGTKHK